MLKSKANLNTLRTGGGFSAIELVITAAVLTIITGFGLMGITRARASVRLSGAAREYASYIEKARMLSIRSHADDAGERASVAINDDKTSYTVTMDLDGDGDLDTRIITLPDGLSFETVETIAFDWRGRTWNTVGVDTIPNAQVSITIKGNNDSVLIDVTGSGDITIDSKVFDDSVPNVKLNVGDLAGGATPVPTPVVIETTPTPPVAVPSVDPTQNPDPDPEPGPGDGTITLPDPVDSTPTPDPTVIPSPDPTPDSRPTPPALPAACNISVDKLDLFLSADGTGKIKVGHDASMSLAITGTSSKPSDLQVTPGGAQTVSAGGSTTFTVKSKRALGTYIVTFNSSCGSKVVSVTIALGLSL